MQILRVLNNNVVLSRDNHGREVILTGRGLGFQAKPGDTVREDRIVRTFVPTDGRDPDHLAMILADIDETVVRAVSLAITEAGIENPDSTNPSLVIAVADHIAGYIRRLQQGLEPIVYPLEAEVLHLYGEEYAKAQRLLRAVNVYLDYPLPDSEAVALALHLVNAGFTSGDLSFTYTMTGVIRQMLAVISERFHLTLGQDSISVARFITHVRYLFVRVHQGAQLNEANSLISEGIRAAYPEALRTAEQLATVVQLRLGAPLSEDEVAYLALHVARMANDTPDSSAAP